MVFQVASTIPGSWVSHCVELCDSLGIGPGYSNHCLRSWFQSQISQVVDTFRHARRWPSLDLRFFLISFSDPFLGACSLGQSFPRRWSFSPPRASLVVHFLRSSCGPFVALSLGVSRVLGLAQEIAVPLSLESRFSGFLCSPSLALPPRLSLTRWVLSEPMSRLLGKCANVSLSAFHVDNNSALPVVVALPSSVLPRKGLSSALLAVVRATPAFSSTLFRLVTLPWCSGEDA